MASFPSVDLGVLEIDLDEVNWYLYNRNFNYIYYQ